jgi:hypothetical protein
MVVEDVWDTTDSTGAYAIPIGFELEGNLTFSIDSHERRTYDLLETASQDSVLSHIYHLDVWLPPR